jgi:hypothetical protein
MMALPKPEVLQGTLDLMVLKSLAALGPLHGYGIARRIEQVSDETLGLNEGHGLSVPSSQRLRGTRSHYSAEQALDGEMGAHLDLLLSRPWFFKYPLPSSPPSRRHPTGVQSPL